MILVDSSVLLDLATNDPVWGDWSQYQLERASLLDRLCVNDVIYAEVSVGYRERSEVDVFFSRLQIDRSAITDEALFRAGKAFLAYRRRGGLRTTVLPDFFIGAHAEVAAVPLLTRDAERIRTYFPTVSVVAPT